MSNFGEEKRIQHVVHVICKVLQVKIEEVTNIVAMKKGSVKDFSQNGLQTLV